MARAAKSWNAEIANNEISQILNEEKRTGLRHVIEAPQSFRAEEQLAGQEASISRIKQEAMQRKIDLTRLARPLTGRGHMSPAIRR